MPFYTLLLLEQPHIEIILYVKQKSSKYRRIYAYEYSDARISHAENPYANNARITRLTAMFSVYANGDVSAPVVHNINIKLCYANNYRLNAPRTALHT